MAHEMTSTDNSVFHRHPAWHGLGLVIPEAWGPVKAAREIMPYTIEQQPLFYRLNGKQVICESHVMNIRDDTGEEMGIVSADYQPVQNEDTARFCEALLEEGKGKVEIESAGTIRGGKRIWFLLKGEPFQVSIEDKIAPYILVSNGHDGGAQFRVTPTEVRVVCSNTMHMVIPRTDTGELMSSAIAIRHTKNVMVRVEEARNALKHYADTMRKNREVVDKLIATDVNTEQVQRFFLESYTTDFGEIPDNPKKKVEENRRNRALSAYDSFCRRFDDEKVVAGTNAWNMLNAYTGLVQHDQKARGSDDVDRLEKRVYRNLFGLNQDRTQNALQRAYIFALSS